MKRKYCHRKRKQAEQLFSAFRGAEVTSGEVHAGNMKDGFEPPLRSKRPLDRNGAESSRVRITESIPSQHLLQGHLTFASEILSSSLSRRVIWIHTNFHGHNFNLRVDILFYATYAEKTISMQRRFRIDSVEIRLISIAKSARLSCALLCVLHRQPR